MQPHRGTTVLVLGILSLVVCAICGPIAWVMGNRDLASMNSGLMDPSGMDQTKAGRICGIVGTVILILSAGFLILYLVFVVLMIGVGVSQGGLSQ